MNGARTVSLNRRRPAYRVRRSLHYALLIVLALMWLMPVLFVILTAFKTDAELTLRQFRWLPSSWKFVNFENAFHVSGYTWGTYFLNSLFVTGVTVTGSLFFNSLAGFAFARLYFRGRDVIFIVFLAGMMIPPQSIILPQYLIMKLIPLAGGNNILGQGGTGLLNTLWAVIIPQLCGAFGIFLCKQFYLNFPQEMDDAARIDGCREFRIYWNIYLPQSLTILASLVIIKSISVWNDFFFPLIMTTSSNKRTVQLALQVFKSNVEGHWSWLMAVTLITILPVIVIFMLAQRYFVQSVTTSGMKN
jgi:multiple sugar transport system permease protein